MASGGSWLVLHLTGAPHCNHGAVASVDVYSVSVSISGEPKPRDFFFFNQVSGKARPMPFRKLGGEGSPPPAGLAPCSSSGHERPREAHGKAWPRQSTREHPEPSHLKKSSLGFHKRTSGTLWCVPLLLIPECD